VTRPSTTATCPTGRRLQRLADQGRWASLARGKRFELSKGCFGLDQCQARLYTAILRHTVLVMTALAICAVAAVRIHDLTGTQLPSPASPDAMPPADLGLIPLTIREVRLLAAALDQPTSPAGSSSGAATRHDPGGSTKRARLARNYAGAVATDQK
jgi:hypothetical protein